MMMEPIYISSSEDDSNGNEKFLNRIRRREDDDLQYGNKRVKHMAEQSYVNASPSQQFGCGVDVMKQNRRRGLSRLQIRQRKPDSSKLSGIIQNKKFAEQTLTDLNQPTVEVELPKGTLSVSLLRHQKIALAWMMQREKGVGVCHGGILADDQGLGKTICMIALIQMQRTLQQKHYSDNKELPIEPKPFNSRLHWERSLTGGTLVVCPSSVLRQWARELDEKVAEKSKLSVLIYHGSKRTLDPIELAKYDVVLTTYALVTIELSKYTTAGEEKFGSNKLNRKNEDDYGRGTLGKVLWFRVILDEAHIIKNHKTKAAQACCRLRARTRWCLSGTPLQNEIVELYSYFKFLRHYPYSDYEHFRNAFKKRKSIRSCYQRIGTVLRVIMLRRTKETVIDGKRILDLPPKTIHLRHVKFSVEERNFYDNLEKKFAWLFRLYAANGTVESNYAKIILMLLRLRQVCDNSLLVKNAHKKVVGKKSLETAKTLPKEKLQSLLEKLENSLAICGVCRDAPEPAVVSICGHVFCFECVLNHLTEMETATCPKAGCKEVIGVGGIFTEEILKECLPKSNIDGHSSSLSSDEYVLNISNDEPSSKIKSALQVLQSCCNPSISCPQENEFGAAGTQISRPEKAIVFSQWTSMLDLLEKELCNTGLKYRRLDGTMSLSARDSAVKDFNINPEVDVMLMSLKAGNLGLNMVAASHVILLDPWWNPTSEDQAVDRAHRIGQTRPVTVTRLTIQNTVEDRILTLQENKRRLVSAVMGEDQSQESGTRLTVQDLKHLFNVG